MSPPLATYRLQMHAGFTFDDAAEIVDYLADLGVSHVYLSPILQAAAGSTHGYDVVDHSRLNVELGGDAGHERLAEALRRRGLGQIVDIVPNHMAIGESNVWWWDVLENGPSSRWAAAFDIDWDTEGASRQKVLLPFLGDHYGRVLEAGDLRLDRDGGSFVIRYFDHVVPVSPRTLDDLLGRTAELFESDELASLAVAFGRLPPANVTDEESVIERHRDKEVLRGQLARLLDENLHLARAVDGAVVTTNQDPDALDALIDRQNYRLSYWRSAGQELDYRRFFDVPTLIGLRIERRRIFTSAHEKVLDLVKRGLVDGLRVDHIDGLRYPAGYLQRLRDESAGSNPGGTYVVVEKILEHGEALPATWPVAGTTGYDFLNVVAGLFVDPAGEEPLTRLYGEVTGRDPSDAPSWDDAVAEGKNLVLREVLGADVNNLVNRLVTVCEQHRRYRDYTRRDLHGALWEVLACFPVYRTYVQPGEPPTEADVAVVETAVAAAAGRRPQIDPELFSFLGDLLLLRVPGEAEVDFGLRFQQVTGPVMAKGVEDTAFYRFNRLVSLNDVGGDPGRFGTSVDEFHAFNRGMAADWPATMLATSTHDTKRSEDVRARIGMLSEIPAEWADTVRRWTLMNARHKTAVPNAAALPDANTEYLLYQTLVGAFPLSAARAVAYMEKASREAKEHTSWIDPEPAYDDALRGFIEGVLADPEFTADLVEFVGPLVDPGRAVSVAQALLKLTSPGVPDLYQGTEVWDLSLVDPDNRRPVDYGARRSLLEKLRGLEAADVRALADEGAAKLWTVWRTLAVRREHPEAFGEAGTYAPLVATGAQAGHVVGFVRGGRVATVVPRLVMGLARAGGWGDTEIELPPGLWTDVLGASVIGSDDDAAGPVSVPVGELLGRFPVALLVRR
ncbi:MAG: (1-_4)-alpha-D-glucan 1-alpha-D-glucosylmutase [Actinomycetota bacterium]|jgi:(1->4)-alpha-D-glucan 1-alpha-D-glucosylmutase|nr:(1->4)-alpha-D-glucan 1-alpha-D-glucosylmutase [Actinomycetota bacterium]